MKVKIFTPNKNGKMEFTKKELEDLLNEVYNEGYCDGNLSYWTVRYGHQTGDNPITGPYVTWSTTSNSNTNLASGQTVDGNTTSSSSYRDQLPGQESLY